MPNPEGDQSDAMGSGEAHALAIESREFHTRGLRARRLHDLTGEKYMLHVEGTGAAQYLDIFRGVRLKMAPRLCAL